jgi:hypothetical protein
LNYVEERENDNYSIPLLLPLLPPASRNLRTRTLSNSGTPRSRRSATRAWRGE